VALDASHLVVADYNNHRVLIYSPVPTNNFAAAQVVLGQADVFNNAPHGTSPVSEQKFVYPSGIAEGGGELFVADQGSNRVLIWPQLPVSASDVPTEVLGQINLQGNASNAGGVTSGSLNIPMSVAADDNTLAVADCGNNRVLLWNKLPRSSGAPATRVLGQPNMRTANAGTGAGMSCPSGVYLAGGALYVADKNNHRVLIWNTLPTADYQPADIVLGQTSLSGNAQNAGGGNVCSASSMSFPQAVAADSTHIFVSDYGNHRVLIFNTLMPMAGQAASLVLGQGTFTDNSIHSLTLATLTGPSGITIDNGRLFLADASDNRLLMWRQIPQQSNALADQVYGQSDGMSGQPNPGGLSASSLYGPSQVLFTTIGIYIADTNNSRIVALPPGSL
jgi:hypothetical protein